MKRASKQTPYSKNVMAPFPFLKFLDPQLVIKSLPSQKMKRGRWWEKEIQLYKRATHRYSAFCLLCVILSIHKSV